MYFFVISFRQNSLTHMQKFRYLIVLFFFPFFCLAALEYLRFSTNLFPSHLKKSVGRNIKKSSRSHNHWKDHPKIKKAVTKSCSGLPGQSNSLGKPFKVGNWLRKDTRDIDQICLPPCEPEVIKLTHTMPTWRLWWFLCSTLPILHQQLGLFA